jgi:hypothetical protein
MTDGLSDDEIEQRLRSAPDERWQEVWDAIVELNDEPEPGRWAGGEQVRTIRKGRDNVRADRVAARADSGADACHEV